MLHEHVGRDLAARGVSRDMRRAIANVGVRRARKPISLRAICVTTIVKIIPTESGEAMENVASLSLDYAMKFQPASDNIIELFLDLS